jgi:small subunit ribosomal protein S3
MGHKVHPTGFRVGVIYDWQSKWYAGHKTYKDQLHEDVAIRKRVMRGPDAGISKVEIDRNANQMTVTIHTAKPGIVIGRNGANVDVLRQDLEKQTGRRVRVNINEIRIPELDAYLVARSIAEQLQRRVAFRRAIKQAVQRTMGRGAKGIKVTAAGRLGGSEMSRRETEKQGRIPLHTLRADIDFGIAEAHTTFGRIGVKCWIYKGDILPEQRPGARTVRRGAGEAVPVEEGSIVTAAEQGATPADDPSIVTAAQQTSAPPAEDPSIVTTAQQTAAAASEPQAPAKPQAPAEPQAPADQTPASE